MPAALWIGCLGMIGALEVPSTPRWSPDARWIAYVHQTPAIAPTVSPGWIYGPVALGGDRRKPEDASPHRLWAVRPEDGQAVLLDGNAGPISDPSWSRDGSAIAFGRLIRESETSWRWEVLIQKGPDEHRVVHREAIGGERPTAAQIRDLVPDWSPDGLTLAVPSLKESGVVLIRVVEGRAIRTINDASHPRWAPEGARLAFYRGRERAELTVVNGFQGDPVKLAELPPDRDGLPGPFWSKDGQALLVIRRGATAPNRPGAGNSAEALKLLRIGAEQGMVESVVDLVHEPIGPEGAAVGVWFADDAKSDATALVTASPGRHPVQITWCPSRPNEVQKRLNPFDESAHLGALAIAPGGGSIAMEIGVGGTWTPPVVCDPVTEALVCVAPDDATREEWLGLILETLWPVLRDALPAASLADESPVERPTILPAPGEFEPGDASASRIRRLSRLALPLVRALRRPDDELRLVLSYFAEDYDTAQEALDTMLAEEGDTNRRGRLLAVKAQILLAKRDFDRVGPWIDHLRETGGRRTFTVEDDPTGPRLVPMKDARDGWPEFLAQRLATMRRVPEELGLDLNDEDEGEFDPVREEVPRRPQAVRF